MMNVHTLCKKSLFHLVATFSSGSLHLIDLPLPRPGFENFLSTWLIRDTKRKRILLVDPGPTSTLPQLYDSLEKLGISTIDYVLLTHIHMDHAGGMGDFLATFPDAKIVAPSNGIKHLIDPSRLERASRETLREMAETYGRMRPVPADAFIDPEQIEGISFMMTPGHAPHHQSIFYDIEEEAPLLFVGEAAGTYIGDAEGVNFYLRPATPPRFFFDKAEGSVMKLMERASSLLCYAHYGYVRHSEVFLSRALAQLRLWKSILEKESGTLEELMDIILEKDSNLKSFSSLTAGEQARERYFTLNSLKGFVEEIASKKE